MCIFSMASMGLSHAQDLSGFQWKNRPVLIFTSTDTHRKYSKQMEIFEISKEQLNERDIVVLVDSNPVPPSNLRRKYKPEGFLFVLIGKDGGVKFKSEEPVSMETLASIIDAMPMRQREMQSQN